MLFVLSFGFFLTFCICYTICLHYCGHVTVNIQNINLALYTKEHLPRRSKSYFILEIFIYFVFSYSHYLCVSLFRIKSIAIQHVYKETYWSSNGPHSADKVCQRIWQYFVHATVRSRAWTNGCSWLSWKFGLPLLLYFKTFFDRKTKIEVIGMYVNKYKHFFRTINNTTLNSWKFQMRGTYIWESSIFILP